MTWRILILCLGAAAAGLRVPADSRPHVRIRAIYGGVPAEILSTGKTLEDYGVNAVFAGSRSITAETVRTLRAQRAGVFAEFNTMHDAEYLKSNPDAAPIGPDGNPSPPPEGWQGICPTHQGHRADRMDTFRALLRQHAIDGVWLDYHHSHASWERAEPVMPDTCFCDRCIAQFKAETGTPLPDAPVPELSRLLLSKYEPRWVQWRCDVFTDWVREFRSIVDGTRPGTLLGTFHCPWSESDFDGALRRKLAIDLERQAQYLDVFSPMPYHARFGHPADPAWISRQVSWLGRHLGVEGKGGERLRIWPIVQISDWGEPVPVSQVAQVLDHGTRLPATGAIVFAWGSLRKQPEKVEEIGRYFRGIAAPQP